MIKRNAIFVEEEDMERILTQKLEEDTNNPAGLDVMEVRTKGVRSHVDCDIELNCWVDKKPRDME